MGVIFTVTTLFTPRLAGYCSCSFDHVVNLVCACPLFYCKSEMRVDKPLQERLNCSGHKEFRIEFMQKEHCKMCNRMCKSSYNLTSHLPACKKVKLWNSLMQTHYVGSPKGK